jgi:hypothetical protein
VTNDTSHRSPSTRVRESSDLIGPPALNPGVNQSAQISTCGLGTVSMMWRHPGSLANNFTGVAAGDPKPSVKISWRTRECQRA